MPSLADVLGLALLQERERQLQAQRQAMMPQPPAAAIRTPADFSEARPGLTAPMAQGFVPVPGPMPQQALPPATVQSMYDRFMRAGKDIGAAIKGSAGGQLADTRTGIPFMRVPPEQSGMNSGATGIPQANGNAPLSDAALAQPALGAAGARSMPPTLADFGELGEPRGLPDLASQSMASGGVTERRQGRDGVRPQPRPAARPSGREPRTPDFVEIAPGFEVPNRSRSPSMAQQVSGPQTSELTPEQLLRRMMAGEPEQERKPFNREDVALAALMGGLGMLSTKNIGSGGLLGVQHLAGVRQREAQQAENEQTRQMQAAEALTRISDREAQRTMQQQVEQGRNVREAAGMALKQQQFERELELKEADIGLKQQDIKSKIALRQERAAAARLKAMEGQGNEEDRNKALLYIDRITKADPRTKRPTLQTEMTGEYAEDPVAFANIRRENWLREYKGGSPPPGEMPQPMTVYRGTEAIGKRWTPFTDEDFNKIPVGDWYYDWKADGLFQKLAPE